METDRLNGMTIHEWKIAHDRMEANYMAAQIDNDYLMETNHNLAKKLAMLRVEYRKTLEDMQKTIDDAARSIYDGCETD